MEMEMEKEKEKEMEKKFSALHKKLGNLETQLTPIFSKSPETETLPSCAILSDEINQNFHFINSLLTAEMASNSPQNTGRDEIRHLAQIAHRVKVLQNVCRAWSTSDHASSFVESSEAPRCSYTDPDEDHVDEEENELDNYDDHDEGEELPVGFRICQNPMFESHDDDQDGSVELGEVSQDDADLEEKESVTDDSETEDIKIKVECIRGGDRSEEVESEESRIKDTIRDYYDQKESKTKEHEEDSDDGYDNGVETHYCYRVVFWGGLIGMGIISAMAGFSEFPDHHSPVTLLTPT